MKKKMALLIKNHKVLTTEIVIFFIAIIVLIILGVFGVFNSNTIETNEQEKTDILNLSVMADESLDGEIGKNILNKIQTNINNNANITDETKQATSNIIEESNTVSSSKTTSNDNKSNVDNTPKDSESSTSNFGNNESSHIHTWVDHTATRWVSNIVTVVDTPAQTIEGARLYTKNADGTWIANGETYWFENGFTIDDFKNILKDKVKNEGYIGNYQNVKKTVPAVTHTEDQGYNETYVDYQYCSVCGQKR